MVIPEVFHFSRYCLTSSAADPNFADILRRQYPVDNFISASVMSPHVQYTTELEWCIGFHGVLVARGSTGMASLRRCQKLPLCLIDPMPAGSRMDLPLAKAKPISDTGSTSGRT